MNNLVWPLVTMGIVAIGILVGVFAGKAAYYAFYIGLYFMVALMLVNLVGLEFLGLPSLDMGYALVASILVQTLTYLGLRWYFDRKGDF
jgi:hypothetical protein